MLKEIKTTNKVKKTDLIPDNELVTMTIENLNNYGVIIDRYEKRLLTYIQRVIYVSKDDAQDILQEVFIKAYRNINGFDSKYSFSSWIYRIAHNEAVSFLRKSKKRIESNSDLEIFDKISSEEDIEDDFIRDIKRKEIRNLLSKLDTKYREVLVLRYFEDMEYNQISDILHTSVGNVSSLISRGKKEFKILVEKYGKNI